MDRRKGVGVALIAGGVALAAWSVSLLLRPEIELGHVLAAMTLGFSGLLLAAGFLVLGQRAAGLALLGAHLGAGLAGWLRILPTVSPLEAALGLLTFLLTGPALVVLDAPVWAALGAAAGASGGVLLARKWRG